MPYGDALRSSYGAIDNLPNVPDVIRSSVFPSIDQAKQILELAIRNSVDLDAAKETSLVAHTCILSALSRLRADIESTEFGLNNNPDVIHYLHLLEELVETWAVKDLALEYHYQLSFVAASQSPPANPNSADSNHHNENSTVNDGGGGGGGDINYLAAQLPGDSTNTAEIIFRHAEQAMAVAEQAVLANDRMLSARSFHFAVV